MDGHDAAVSVKRSAVKQSAFANGAANGVQAATAYKLIDNGLPGPLSGLYLKAAVSVFELPYYGSKLFRLYTSYTPSLNRIYQTLRTDPLPEAPRPTAVHGDTWGGPDLVHEEICSSADAHSRLDAGLHSVQRGGPMAGTTKCSTASNARPTILDYNFAYTHGMITPSAVAERVIAFLEEHNPKQHWMSAWSAQHIREQAAAATARYEAGNSLSVLDGVPFVVKDNIDALPYETSYGTTFMGKLHPAKADAPCVAALKELGAVLLGKSSMVELGFFPHGHNPHSGAILNPHHPSRTAGGSSSGSAAVVAAGVCPIAIGNDGGGSIRIPASYNGVTGLKPTAGRLADDSGCRRNYSSTTVTGPIANSIADLTLLYAVMANVNYTDTDTRKPGPASLCLPGVAEAAAAAAATPPRPLGLPRVLLQHPEESASALDQQDLTELKPLAGFRVGVFPKWCFDCTPAVAGAMRATLNRLVQLGAQQVEVALPDLDMVQVGHLAMWAQENMANAETQGYLHDWELRGQLNLDTRMFLAAASTVTDKDYLQAQRMRARVMAHFKHAFESCDIILTPATPSVAPVIPAGANTTGVYDPAATYEAIRYTLPANVAGLPAVVLPAGRQMGNNQPIGVQFMGPPFSEAALLRAAAALEAQLLEEGMPKPLPTLLINPIQGEKGAHPLALQMTAKLWSKKYGKSTPAAH